MVYLEKLRLFGVIVILVYALSHIPFMTAEPVDHHSWRQVTTAGVARAFYTESSNIFHPRIFDRGDKTGITGMEFPFFNYIIFVFIKIFGYANWYGRLAALLFGTIGIFWFWRFAALELGETAGLCSLVFISLSPLYFYFARNIQPDIPMLSLLIGSFYFIKIWELERNNAHFWLACLFFTLAALIKLPAVVFLPFFAVIIYKSQRRKSLRQPGDYAFFVVTIAIVACWYLYSSFLVREYGLKYFYLGGDLHQNLSFLLDWRFWRVALISRIPEIVTNYAIFPFLVTGIVLYRKIGIPVSVAALVVLLGLYYAVGGYHLYVHDYYSLPAVPVVALIAGGGAWFVLRNPVRTARAAAILLLIIAPIVTLFRVAPWYKMNFPAFPLARGLGERYVPKGSLMVAAWRVDPTLLFFTFRNGWAMPPQNVDERELNKMGARFLITTAYADSLIPDHETLRLVAQESSLRLYQIELQDTANSIGVGVPGQ